MVAFSSSAAAKSGAERPSSLERIACCAYSSVSPRASRFSSESDCERMCCWNSRPATAIEIKPAITTPARKNAGSRKRSELNMSRGYAAASPVSFAGATL